MDTMTFVTQSRFYTPAFNAAIFDGPIRIYFAQAQEAQALKIYFSLQERFSEARSQSQGIFAERSKNIFVMLYPTAEAFDLSFSGSTLSSIEADLVDDLSEKAFAQERLGSDFVLGVRGPVADEGIEGLCLKMDKIVHSLDFV